MIQGVPAGQTRAVIDCLVLSHALCWCYGCTAQCCRDMASRSAVIIQIRQAVLCIYGAGPEHDAAVSQCSACCESGQSELSGIMNLWS